MTEEVISHRSGTKERPMTRTVWLPVLAGLLLTAGCNKTNSGRPKAGAPDPVIGPAPPAAVPAQTSPAKPPVTQPAKENVSPPVVKPPAEVEKDPAVLAIEAVNGKVVRDAGKPGRPVVRVDL